jgi:hypothetical protein
MQLPLPLLYARVALLICMALVLPGCAFHSQPDSISLCGIDEGDEKQPSESYFGITKWNASRNKNYSYQFHASSFRSDNYTLLSGEKDMFWIEVSALTLGVGLKEEVDPPPMVYDPRFATLTLNNVVLKSSRFERSVFRDPEPRNFADDVLHGPANRPSGPRKVPTNLNPAYASRDKSEGAEKPNKILIGFKLPIPLRASDRYKFDPGSILLDGDEQKLPSYKSCLTQGWGVIVGAHWQRHLWGGK